MFNPSKKEGSTGSTPLGFIIKLWVKNGWMPCWLLRPGEINGRRWQGRSGSDQRGARGIICQAGSEYRGHALGRFGKSARASAHFREVAATWFYPTFGEWTRWAASFCPAGHPFCQVCAAESSSLSGAWEAGHIMSYPSRDLAKNPVPSMLDTSQMKLKLSRIYSFWRPRFCGDAMIFQSIWIRTPAPSRNIQGPFHTAILRRSCKLKKDERAQIQTATRAVNPKAGRKNAHTQIIWRYW